MKTVLIFIIIFIVAMATGEGGLQVRIRQGILRGFKEKSVKGRDIFSFLGIPFAEPPVGNLRFKDPVPGGPWSGILDANREPETCVQYNTAGYLHKKLIPEGQEDCLYLNVFTPKPSQCEANLPVMVFIHGGAFYCGSAKAYKPYLLLNEEVILVVIQYRIGPFGFLSTADSTISGNYGLKDQILALKWVQENIAFFGGDSGRVTIFGESAGAACTHLLMLSPLAKGLFHGVISQSGGAGCAWSVNRFPRKSAEKYGEAIGCLLQDSHQYLKCLQEKDAYEVLEATSKLMEWGSSQSWISPSIDGDLIPDEPLLLLKNKKYNKVNFMAGITKHEGAMFLISLLSDQERIDALLQDFDRIAPFALLFQDEEASSPMARSVFEYYLEGKKLSADSLIYLVDMYTDRVFSICHDQSTKLHTYDSSIYVYRYQLDWRGQYSYGDIFNLSNNEWVCHGDDLFYLFTGGPYYSMPFERPQDLQLREIFIKLWTNFAATGNPTPDDSLGFIWTPATPSDFKHLKLLPEPYMSDYVNTKAGDFWRSLPLTENKLLPNLDLLSTAREEL